MPSVDDHLTYFDLCAYGPEIEQRHPVRLKISVRGTMQPPHQLVTKQPAGFCEAEIVQ